MTSPNEPGYYWYKDSEYDGIWLVMQDGRITDGAFIYGCDEFDGEWTPVMTPEEIDAALEAAAVETLESVRTTMDEFVGDVPDLSTDVGKMFLLVMETHDATLEQARSEAVSEKAVIEAKKRIEAETGDIVTLIGKGALEAIKEQARQEGREEILNQMGGKDVYD